MLFYCFWYFYFIINISDIFIDFRPFLFQVYSHKNINQSCNLTHCFVFACLLLQINSTDCSLVMMKSYCFNPNLALNFCVANVLQSITTLTANSLSIKIQLGCFLGSSSSSYQWFLRYKGYFTGFPYKFLWSYPYSMCFWFTLNILLLSTIVSTSFFTYVSLLEVLGF